jgi:Secretion system C-terminal sorting domain
MKSAVLFSVVCMLIFVSQVSFSQTGSDYYLPLSVGNQLNLHTVEGTNWGYRATIFSFEGSDLISGRQCFRQIGKEISDFNGQIDTIHIFWLRKDSVGNLIMSAVSTNGSENPDSALVVNFNYFPNEFLTPGYSRMYSFGDISQDSVISVTETVVTSAGTFNNCIEILETKFDSMGIPIFREHHYYANGVGMIKNVRTLPVSEAHTDDLISYVATGVNDEVSNQTPDNYLLSQNYPNPFNPSTKISWQTPVGNWQILKIYDVLGTEIATLIDEFKSAGKYEVDFDASGLPSGIYFYRLQAGSFTETRKLLLIK